MSTRNERNDSEGVTLRRDLFELLTLLHSAGITLTFEPGEKDTLRAVLRSTDGQREHSMRYAWIITKLWGSYPPDANLLNDLLETASHFPSFQRAALETYPKR